MAERGRSYSDSPSTDVIAESSMGDPAPSRVVVLIPAHNESGGTTKTVTALRLQRGPRPVPDILSILITIIVGACITLASTPPATAASCTTVWLTAPSYEHVVNTGAQRCLNLGDQSNGWVRIYKFDNPNSPAVDFVHKSSLTRTLPNNGRYQPNANRARNLAATYGIKLRFANYDLTGRAGCRSTSNPIPANYRSSTRWPGQGLIQLGTGPSSTCMRDRREVMETLKHEIAHERIETKCGNWNPPMMKGRGEQVADAYAWLYLNAETRSPGNYGFVQSDITKARKIAHGDC
jgi:hypothetical protein